VLLVVFLAMAGPICGVKGAPGLRPGLVRVYAVVAVAKAGAYVAFAVLLHHIGVYILTLYQVKVCVCVCKGAGGKGKALPWASSSSPAS